MPAPSLHSFFASVPLGMEQLLEKELLELGAQSCKRERAGVRFEATLEKAYRICLWSRLASRVLLPISRFKAPDAKKLYAGVKAIRWRDHLKAEGTLAIDVTQSQNQGTELQHTHFVAQKAKDAVVDQFMSTTGVRPSVQLQQPDLRIHIHLEKGEASVSLDLSGDSLHRRGYRAAGAQAPLKENLAAAILILAGWPEISAPKAGFVDLMCGSGTLAIEAALMSTRTAPGFFREYFGFLGWLQHDAAAWRSLKKEAIDSRITDPKLLPRFYAFDRDNRTLAVARENAAEAMLGELIHFERRELKDSTQIAPNYGTTGLVGANPPYGERLSELEELKPEYALLGDTFKKKAPGWKGFVFTGSAELSKVIGLRPSARHLLYNGSIECRLLCYEMYSGSRETPEPAPSGQP